MRRSSELLSVGCALLLAGTLSSAQAGTDSSAATRKSAHKTHTSHAKAAPAAPHRTSRKGKKSRKTSWRRGQQKIDGQRARAIQAALIREHYLEGEPTGVWDQTAQKAMERYQADHGWQTKTVPDARALIKLGLGPNHEHLLNPESAMTSPPPAPRTMPVSKPAPSTDPSNESNPPQK